MKYRTRLAIWKLNTEKLVLKLFLMSIYTNLFVSTFKSPLKVDKIPITWRNYNWNQQMVSLGFKFPAFCCFKQSHHCQGSFLRRLSSFTAPEPSRDETNQLSRNSRIGWKQKLPTKGNIKYHFSGALLDLTVNIKLFPCRKTIQSKRQFKISSSKRNKTNEDLNLLNNSINHCLITIVY